MGDEVGFGESDFVGEQEDAKEKLAELLDDVEIAEFTEWEVEFLFSVADQDKFSDAQLEKIKDIYRNTYMGLSPKQT